MVGQIIPKVTASTKIRSATAVVRKAATCKEKQGNKARNTVREKKGKKWKENSRRQVNKLDTSAKPSDTDMTQTLN